MLRKNSSDGVLSRMGEERGGVLGWFAVWLPVLVLFAALAELVRAQAAPSASG
jgi:hypothetical protein